MINLYRCEHCKTLYRTEQSMDSCPMCQSHGEEHPVVMLTHESEGLDYLALRLAWMIFDGDGVSDEHGSLAQDFFGFRKGDKTADVWQWFDSHYVGGVMKLMEDVQKLDENGMPKNNNSMLSSDDAINKINEAVSRDFDAQGCMLVTGAYRNETCSVSFTGDRRLIEKVIPTLMAASASQLPIKDPKQYFETLAHNAFVLYKMNVNLQR